MLRSWESRSKPTSGAESGRLETGAPTRSVIPVEQVEEPFFMSAQPISRGPGRPRKNPENEPTRNTSDSAEKVTLPPDERIGQKVDDERWTEISFDDGRGYRIVDGVIVERVA